MSPTMQRLHMDLANHAGDIALMFKPGAKVSIIVRNPTIPGDAGVFVSDDEIDEVIEELRKRKEKE